MAVLNFVAKVSQLRLKRRERTGFEALDRGVCENRKEKTSLVLVYGDICLTRYASCSATVA